MALEITEANFEEVVLNSDKVVVLDLWAEWCGPCRVISPLIEEISHEYEGRAVIGKVDVDSNPGISTRYGVLNIPTVLYIKGGQLVDKIVGAVAKKKLVQVLEKYL